MNDTLAQQPAVGLLFALLPIVGFLAIFFLVGNLLALTSGWKKLVMLYSATGEPTGETFRWRSFQLGWASYNNCVNLVAGKASLHVSLVLLMRLGHAPFALPWREVTATAQQGWLFSYVDLRAAKAPEVRMRLKRSLAEKLLPAAGQKMPAPVQRNR